MEEIHGAAVEYVALKAIVGGPLPQGKSAIAAGVVLCPYHQLLLPVSSNFRDTSPTLLGNQAAQTGCECTPPSALIYSKAAPQRDPTTRSHWLSLLELAAGPNRMTSVCDPSPVPEKEVRRDNKRSHNPAPSASGTLCKRGCHQRLFPLSKWWNFTS